MSLTTDQKLLIKRMAIDLWGIPYSFGAETKAVYPAHPPLLDCSEWIEMICRSLGIPCPDGTQAQWDASSTVDYPLVGDLVFKARSPSNNKLLHVGIIIDSDFVSEASSSFGIVCVKPIWVWKGYPTFLGFRRLKILT